MKINEEIRTYGKENKVPITLDDTLCFLIQTINENNSKEILEIGTAIGYGCIAMAENTNCKHIDTLEIDTERFNIANQNIQSKNLENKISTHLIDAKEFLLNCNKKYDLVYLDGPKGQYINYLPLITKLLNSWSTRRSEVLHFLMRKAITRQDAFRLAERVSLPIRSS